MDSRIPILNYIAYLRLVERRITSRLILFMLVSYCLCKAKDKFQVRIKMLPYSSDI